MKRQGNLIPQISDMNNLMYACWKASRSKLYKKDVMEYVINLDRNLLQLGEQISSGDVRVGKYQYFVIYEPKERIICAASFEERVLHHAIMNVCHDSFEQYQIYDSYATRKNKGTYAALHRAEFFQKKYEWYLKIDVKKYFDSIDHTVLMNMLRRRIKDSLLLKILDRIIESYNVSENKGLPIGNLTSQYFANFYLAFADRFIKEFLKIRAYVRYMDDMVLWSDQKAKLKHAAQSIKSFFDNPLKLTLKYCILNKSINGLSFLGYRIFKLHTKLSKTSKHRFKSKMVKYAQYLNAGFWSQEDYSRHILPLLAFARHASTIEMRRTALREISLKGDDEGF